MSRFSWSAVPCDCRGNRRAVIIHDDADAMTYLERLERYRLRDGCTRYAYEKRWGHGRSLPVVQTDFEW